MVAGSHFRLTCGAISWIRDREDTTRTNCLQNNDGKPNLWDIKRFLFGMAIKTFRSIASYRVLRVYQNGVAVLDLAHLTENACKSFVG